MKRDLTFLLLASFLAFGVGLVVSSNPVTSDDFIVMTLGLLATSLILWWLDHNDNLSYLSGMAVVLVFVFGSGYLARLTWSVQVLRNNPIHIGDVEMETFDPQRPQKADSVSLQFVLEEEPNEARLKVSAKDIDPDLRAGPVLIRINGAFLGYLNNYAPFSGTAPSDEHEVGFRDAEIPVPAGFLKQGTNRVSIRVIPTIYGLDNVNIREIKLMTR